MVVVVVVEETDIENFQFRSSIFRWRRLAGLAASKLDSSEPTIPDRASTMAPLTPRLKILSGKPAQLDLYRLSAPLYLFRLALAALSLV